MYHHTTDGRDLECCRFHFRCVTNKIVFTTPEKRRFLVCLQFYVNFLRIYVIEVNSLAVDRSELRDSKENVLFAEVNKGLAELEAFISA